jgi:predicted RNA-binding Zn-ribbon protein involved in translation (DUF1610 family)
MPEKNNDKKYDNDAEQSCVNNDLGLEKHQPRVFYRCTCHECGEDALELCGLGVFYRAEFLGVTDGDEFGCGSMQLDGDYDWEIECTSCGYRVFDGQEVTLDNLLEWAASLGKSVTRLESGFVCPVCGSRHLDRIETGKRSVRAVYEIDGNSETEAHAEVALSFERVLEGGDSVRYCCSKKHELTKQDGSPVQTPEELVEWLKAHQTTTKE